MHKLSKIEPGYTFLKWLLKIELEYTIIAVKNENKIYAVHKKSKIELECAIIIMESENKVSVMHKNRKIELTCAITTVTNESNVCVMHRCKKISIASDKQQWLLRDGAASVQSKKGQHRS